jgi:hypothetical protein
MGRSRKVLIGGGVALLCVIAAAFYLGRNHWGAGERDWPARAYEAMTGSRFLPLPSNPFQSPAVRELDVPTFADANGVWGATGRDDSGGIWIGVSAKSAGMSAHLMHYDPATDVWQDRGAVTAQLRAAGLHRNGEGQVKIHSKIIPADDGLLYFASMDEEGESASANAPPRWGGHLWRIDPGNGRWDHLFAVPEGLIATAGMGRYVYALGYWGHVLYQYDIASGARKRTVVGSVGGHVTRNFLADARGHAYVPRLTARPDAKTTVELVEFDADLREVAATPLDFYLGKGGPDANHGIIGLAYLADGRIVFTTHRGHLYMVDPARAGPALVTPVGWFHPQGEAYVPSLFSFSGKTLLAGVTQRGGRYEWVVFDLATAVSAAFPLDTKELRTVLLYGSVSRDDAGRFYVVGWAKAATGGQRPLVLQITAAP